MNYKELRTDRARLIEDARLLLRADKVDAETQNRASLMLDDADKLKAQIDLGERADAAEKETRQVQPIAKPLISDNKEARDAASIDAFRSYITTGRVTPEQNACLRTYNRAKMAPEVRDLLASGNTDGGYLIPSVMAPQIEVATLAYGQLLTKVKNWNTDSGAPITWPLQNDTSNYSTEINPGTAVTELDPAFGSVTIPVSTFSTGIVRVSKSLLMDSAFDLGGFIQDQFAIRKVRGLNLAATVGSTSGDVQGIVAAAYVGATSAAPTAIGFEDIVNLYGALEPSYLPNASFMLNNSSLKTLIGLLDGYSRPLFVPSMSSGVPDQILGKPFFINQSMANIAATSKSILFGDFSHYLLRNVGGFEVMVLSELFAAYYERAFVGFHRHGSRLLDAGTHPLLALQQHS